MTVKVQLAGNPNCGKTTLFNALTGARQKIGNWPGVTVEKKTGVFTHLGESVEITDLPGTYSLNGLSETSSIDERIVCQAILNREADVIVNIIDASHLERHLYLTLQLLEMKVPMVIALNMMDAAEKKELSISISKLEKILGCKIVALQANKSKGIVELKNAILAAKTISPFQLSYDEKILAAQKELTSELKNNDWLALRMLEENSVTDVSLSAEIVKKAHELRNQLKQLLEEDVDIIMADTRYRFIEFLLQQSVTQKKSLRTTVTKRIDNVVLNRVLGIPIFLSVMYFMFLFAINIGGAFQDFFDIGSNTIFVDGFSVLLAKINAPAWLIALLAHGVGKGINTTLTFIPVIGAMFLFLALLEDSGYMARAAFVVDRVMRALGLPGKSFVPMIVGFGCNVPAVMGARTLENKRDRILTALMTPFMSCGARLAIFAVFTAAFFPVGGQNIVFLLYVTGIVVAVFTGFILRKTLLQGEPAPLVLELPSYHVPQVKTLFLHAWQRLKGFVLRAGKWIVPICVLLGMLNALTLQGTIATTEGDSHSLLSYIGQWITPIFAPMGIHENNWPAAVGLLTGVLAKEVVIGTLNALYSQMGQFDFSEETFHFWESLKEAVMSIPANLADIGHSLGNPVLAKAPVHALSQGVYGLMYQRFDGQAGAMAYLLFVLLYLPCISTVAAIARELSRGWAIFSALWSTGIAYFAAVIFYQIATFTLHPFSSLLWIVGLLFLLGLTVTSIRFQSGGQYEFARH